MSFVMFSLLLSFTNDFITMRKLLTTALLIITAYGYSQDLPLTGGTLTGPLNGTSATFSDNVVAPNIVHGGAGAYTFLGPNSANMVWRAGFYNAFNTPGAPNLSDFGFVNIPL